MLHELLAMLLEDKTVDNPFSQFICFSSTEIITDHHSALGKSGV